MTYPKEGVPSTDPMCSIVHQYDGSVPSALGFPGAIGLYALLWIAPLVALKATTCVIQGVVYCRLLTVYLSEMAS